MATYDSFIFAGHGTSEKTGQYDPGAVNGNVRENDLTEQIVAAAMKYIKTTGLSIHQDSNNFADDDLVGNTYRFKCGMTVHINAGGGTGPEIYVPSQEKYLSTDFAIVSEISQLLGTPNRGVKSKDYNTGQVYMRTNGVALPYTDYFKEIRNAWNQGISLAILEVGFIDTGDLQKMQANIDGIGFLVAQYIATNCDVVLEKPQPPQPPSGDIYYRVICGSFKDRNNAEARKVELQSKGYTDVFIDTYEVK